MLTVEQLLKQLHKIKKEHGNIEVCMNIREDTGCHAEDCYCGIYPRDYYLDEPIITVKDGKVIISEY